MMNSSASNFYPTKTSLNDQLTVQQGSGKVDVENFERNMSDRIYNTHRERPKALS